MPFLSKWIRLWNNIFHRKQLERDLDDELQAYVDEMAERKVQAGYDAETARDAAWAELGGVDRIKDLLRQQRVGFGDLRRACTMGVVAMAAFACGASAATALMRQSSANPKLLSSSIAVGAPERNGFSATHFPVLEGRVVDKATRQPLPLVEVGLREFPVRRVTYTDSDGNFLFRNPPNGSYQLEAGNQQWMVRAPAAWSPFPQPPTEYFEFLAPSTMVVKNKSGQAVDGELIDHRVVFKNGPYPPAGKEIRRFPYSSSVVELQTE